MLVIKNGIEAKEFISSLSVFCDDKWTNLWLKETNPVFCVVKYDSTKTIPICMALLHKMDFDPYKIHENPKLLDYIYTRPEDRRKRYAFHLVNKLIKHNNITAFCGNDDSIELFIKCGFSYHENYHLVRFPPTKHLNMDQQSTDKMNKTKTALELYEACKNDGCDTVPDPVNWVYNKEIMRSMWNRYRDDTMAMDNEFMKQCMTENSLAIYQQFMYDNF